MMPNQNSAAVEAAEAVEALKRLISDSLAVDQQVMVSWPGLDSKPVKLSSVSSKGPLVVLTCVQDDRGSYAAQHVRNLTFTFFTVRRS